MTRTCLLLTLGLCFSSLAATLEVTVTNTQQQPLPYTVVELVHPEYLAAPPAEAAKVVQQQLNFQPFVSVVQQGTRVEFPNLDKTRHHVYSFSKAKTFELRLYAGKPEAPVMFDQAGVVTLGCNIHDNMLAYIYVSASRYVALTDADGKASFSELPATTYQLQLWSPWQTQPLPAAQGSINAGQKNITIELDIAPQALPATPKRGFGD